MTRYTGDERGAAWAERRALDLALLGRCRGHEPKPEFVQLLAQGRLQGANAILSKDERDALEKLLRRKHS